MLNLPLILAVLTTSCQWFLLVNGAALVTIEHYNQPAGITYESQQIPIGQRAGPSVKLSTLEPKPTPPPSQHIHYQTAPTPRINAKNDQNEYNQRVYPTTPRPHHQQTLSRRVQITPSPRAEGFSPSPTTNKIRSQSYFHENNPTANPKPKQQVIYPNVRYYSSPQISITQSGQRSQSYYQHPQYSSPSTVPTNQQYANNRRVSYNDQRKLRIQNLQPPCDDSSEENHSHDNADDSELIDPTNQNPILSSVKPETEHDEDNNEADGALDEDNILEYGGIDVQQGEGVNVEQVQPSSEPQQPSPEPQKPQQPPQSQTVNTNNVELRRPAIHQQFYDVEHKVIIRPVGSAVVELDYSGVKKADNGGAEPTKQPDRTYLTPKKEEPVVPSLAPSPSPPTPPSPSPPTVEYSPPTVVYQQQNPQIPYAHQYPTNIPTFATEPPFYDIHPHSYPHPYPHNHHHHHQVPHIYGQSPIYVRPTVTSYDPNLSVGSNEDDYITISSGPQYPPLGDNGGGSHVHHVATPSQPPPIPQPHEPGYTGPAPCPPTDSEVIDTDQTPFAPPPTHEETPLSPSPPPTIVHPTQDPGPVTFDGIDYADSAADGLQHFEHEGRDEVDNGKAANNNNDYDDDDDNDDDDSQDSVIVEAQNQIENQKNFSDYTDVIYVNQKRKQPHQKTHQSYYNQPYQNQQAQADRIRGEISERGDVSTYSNSQADTFYHELPRTQNYKKLNVDIRSRGAQQSRLVQSTNSRQRNPSSKYQTTIYSQKNLTPDLKQRLLDLFSVKGGVTEIVYHPLEPYTYLSKNTPQSYYSRLSSQINYNGIANDGGRNVQARVISVTPIPDHGSIVQAHERTKIQRIVVSKPIENYKPEDFVDSHDYTYVNSGGGRDGESSQQQRSQTAPAKLQQSKVRRY